MHYEVNITEAWEGDNGRTRSEAELVHTESREKLGAAGL